MIKLVRRYMRLFCLQLPSRFQKNHGTVTVDGTHQRLSSASLRDARISILRRFRTLIAPHGVRACPGAIEPQFLSDRREHWPSRWRFQKYFAQRDKMEKLFYVGGCSLAHST